MEMELKVLAYSAAIVFAITVILMTIGFAIWGLPSSLWPPRRNRLVPWTGLEVLAAFVVIEFLAPLAIDMLLLHSGIFRWVYELTGGNFETSFGHDPEKLNRHLAVWGPCFGYPVILGSIAIWFRLVPGFHLYQLGLTTRRLWHFVVLGWLAWIVFGLPCDLFYLVMNKGYQLLFPGPPEIHTVMQIAMEIPTRFEWAMLILSAVLVAPFLEEFLFRGLLLRWLIARPTGVQIVLCLALGMAALARVSKIEEALHTQGVYGLFGALAPILFAALIYAGIESSNRLGLDRRRLIEWRAIQASSLLFAIAHANFWPSPVALFLLAIGLGWLACRTQSIVPCIVTHALFNAVACVELILGLQYA
jgi:membrane protease YdiL (CAAX protease family)